MQQTDEPLVRIKIAGVGGGGNNAIERMIEQDIPMVTYVSIHTDDSGYRKSTADIRIQIGANVTNGRGAGSLPAVGKRAAEESRKEIEDAIKGCDLLFITAGMGGGTGTGAAPVVAETARKLGILTVAAVTKPFAFEGKKRMNNALEGIRELEQLADSMIVIPNDNLKKAAQYRLTLSNAFAMADDVLVQTVKNLVEVIRQSAYINCDFADIAGILRNSGYMHTAFSTVSGCNRVEKVIEQIASNRLLDSSVRNATGILLYICASSDAGLDEIDHISSAIATEADPQANIIFGVHFDETMDDALKAVLMSTSKKPHPYVTDREKQSEYF